MSCTLISRSALVPDYVQLRILLLKLHQLRQQYRRVTLRRENDAVAHHRLQQGLGKVSPPCRAPCPG